AVESSTESVTMQDPVGDKFRRPAESFLFADAGPAHDSDATRVTSYICPGASQPISRSLHLARLHAAWPVCDQCPRRNETEGLTASRASRVQQIQEARSVGLIRTESGLRGQYINQLNRSTIAWLTTVFCDSLVRQYQDQHINPSLPAAAEVEIRNAAAGTVAVGYDSRASSPDLFVGVASAVADSGLNVLDIGRCTAASIQEAVRSSPEVIGGIITTGAGFSPALTGLDVFDAVNESVAVVWRDYQIVLSAVSHNETPVNRWQLELPDGTQRRPVRRLARRSGTRSVVDFESRYRTWISRWFPEHSRTSVIVRTSDPLMIERIEWLTQRDQLNAVCRPVSERAERGEATVSVTIWEDDRGCEISDQYGQVIRCDDLAEQLNRAIRSRSSQVTAHADPASNRFWLTDAGRPSQGDQTEHITDGLATLGLTLKLMESGRLSLSCTR
ncbi:MAG: hypothetical protein KDA96_24495, partial [Planctomycetaceae bacterium]|nr:hypothetical protein [Planctomycetaceae bacterium]